MLCINSHSYSQIQYGGFIRASMKKIRDMIRDRARILYLIFLWYKPFILILLSNFKISCSYFAINLVFLIRYIVLWYSICCKICKYFAKIFIRLSVYLGIRLSAYPFIRYPSIRYPGFLPCPKNHLVNNQRNGRNALFQRPHAHVFDLKHLSSTHFEICQSSE